MASVSSLPPTYLDVQERGEGFSQCDEEFLKLPEKHTSRYLFLKTSSPTSKPLYKFPHHTLRLASASISNRS
ncbi:hypothetical protein TNCV_1733661 [Trichonephila clavipes]|nr:hypothetical protein TNCV_1733661 [Trichonephila clavipes]